RGIDAADEVGLEGAQGLIGGRVEGSRHGDGAATLGDVAEVPEALLLLRDEEGIVGCITEAFARLADGARAAAGVARLNRDAESFRGAVDEEAAGECAL